MMNATDANAGKWANIQTDGLLHHSPASHSCQQQPD